VGREHSRGAQSPHDSIERGSDLSLAVNESTFSGFFFSPNLAFPVSAVGPKTLKTGGWRSFFLALVAVRSVEEILCFFDDNCPPLRQVVVSSHGFPLAQFVMDSWAERPISICLDSQGDCISPSIHFMEGFRSAVSVSLIGDGSQPCCTLWVC
jgi:hypothetical protein